MNQASQPQAMGYRSATSVELTDTLHCKEPESTKLSAKETDDAEKSEKPDEPDNIELPPGYKFVSMNWVKDGDAQSFLSIVASLTKDGEDSNPVVEYHVFTYDFNDRIAGLQFEDITICESAKKQDEPA